MKVISIETRNYLEQMTWMSIEYQSLEKVSYDTKKLIKYFSGYDDNGGIRPLCIKLPQ